ncbi:hypothetical protein F0562_005292 [Nyssa sinensis]|uniref:Uncharacterized protein n=1 Tax=Nyssa sinensis TaxID=561372 RepID=A0A5J5AHS4_9ASTE|nr:hypothetical protein F0562_005292 [Nyssa sinensis]
MMRSDVGMAIELCTENSGMGTSPRISFSYDLSQTDVVPVEQYHFRSNSSSSSIDFDFCVLERFEVESSSADELFFDGKILPIQIKKKIVPPKQIHRTEPPPPPLPLPLPPCDRPDIISSYENSKNKSPKEMKTTTSSESEEKQNSKSFWRFNRSTSLNCGSGYARTLCPLPLLSRSNSTGSTPNVKAHKQHLQKNSPPMKRSKSSYTSNTHHKPPLKKSYGSYGNGVRINPVLNVPSANFFGLGSIFSSNGKERNKKK